MQHNVTDTVLAPFLQMPTGARWRSLLGLMVHGLIADIADEPTPPRYRGDDDLLWQELSPAEPRQLLVRNAGGTRMLVAAGSVLDGGMSMRATATSAFVSAGEVVVIEVEPIGGRWWDEGPPTWRGTLDPAVLALMLQSKFGDEPLASSARTALWSLAPAEVLMAPDRLLGKAGRGWLLYDDEGLVAAWTPGYRASSHPFSRSFTDYTALRSGAVGFGQGNRDVFLFPHDTRLIDRAVSRLQVADF